MKRVTERQKGMPRLNAVVNHEVYQTYYKRICECETDRVFCCHQMNHLLDVARIAYIKNLEEGLGFDKELIYESDKRSRMCLSCMAEKKCNWNEEEKNMEIII